MNLSFLSQRSWLALGLLTISYTLLGWYLAAHHVFWLMGAIVLTSTLLIAWKSNPVLDLLTWLSHQQVVVLMGVSLLFSLFVALTIVRPTLFSLIPLPLITLLYALLEMRAAKFAQPNLFVWLLILTGFGLGLGEAIDLFVTPSMRY